MFTFVPEYYFDTFEKGDVGFHFGTQEQALRRGKDKQAASGRMFRAYLNIKNPYRVNSDIGVWHAPQIALRLKVDGIISEEQYNDILKVDGRTYYSPGAILLRDILRITEKGFRSELGNASL